MIRIDSVTTRGGDKGKTSLGDGTRLSKSNVRIDAIGAVDELNAAIGLLVADLAAYCRDVLVQNSDSKNQPIDQSVNQNREICAKLHPALRLIQNNLFDVGADLCMPNLTQHCLRVTSQMVDVLDDFVATYNQSLPALTSFVLPGNDRCSALAHVCRTTARRAERLVVALNDDQPINGEILRYLNRLSDVFFVCARVLAEVVFAPSMDGVDGVSGGGLWVPAATAV